MSNIKFTPKLRNAVVTKLRIAANEAAIGNINKACGIAQAVCRVRNRHLVAVERQSGATAKEGKGNIQCNQCYKNTLEKVTQELTDTIVKEQCGPAPEQAGDEVSAGNTKSISEFTRRELAMTEGDIVPPPVGGEDKPTGVAATKPHLSSNGGLRGHSVDELFPYRIVAHGTAHWHVYLLDNQLTLKGYPTPHMAAKFAAVCKEFGATTKDDGELVRSYFRAKALQEESHDSPISK